MIGQMRVLNHVFMTLGTRRYHELVKTRWGEPAAGRLRGAVGLLAAPAA